MRVGAGCAAAGADLRSEQGPRAAAVSRNHVRGPQRHHRTRRQRPETGATNFSVERYFCDFEPATLSSWRKCDSILADLVVVVAAVCSAMRRSSSSGRAIFGFSSARSSWGVASTLWASTS